MRRRDFMSMLTGLAAVWPLAARAQSSAMPVVGFLHAGSQGENTKRLAAFLKGLGEAGFVEGRNVAIEYRWASGRNEQLPAMVADLIARKVALITTPGSTAAAIVAKAATTTIPIVFSSGTDPVGLGLVASLSRPGGNATGITSLSAELAAKRLGLSRELVPKASRYYTLIKPSSELAAKRLGLSRELVPKASRYYTLIKPSSELAAPFVHDLQEAATSLGIQIAVLKANTAGEIDQAFDNIPQSPGNIMVFGPEGFFYVRRAHIAELALRRAIPTVFDGRDYVEAGGLASYGPDFFNVLELTGGYVARVLKGAKPADLPVQQATKFELVINRKIAKTLGIEISPTLLATADEVIE